MALAPQARKCCSYRLAQMPMPMLTLREAECLTWVARGKSAQDIGAIMGISPNTVNYHLKTSGGKLRVAGRIQMVVKAMQQGLIEP